MATNPNSRAVVPRMTFVNREPAPPTTPQVFDPGAERSMGEWTYNPTAEYRPEFAAAGRRADVLRTKKAQGTLTPQEAFELENPIPQHLQGSTFGGQPVYISSGNPSRISDPTIGRTSYDLQWSDPTIKGSAYLLNDPAQFQNTPKPLSTKSYPGGPPGWQSVPYSPSAPRGAMTNTPWDVQFQQAINQGPIMPDVQSRTMFQPQFRGGFNRAGAGPK